VLYAVATAEVRVGGFQQALAQLHQRIDVKVRLIAELLEKRCFFVLQRSPLSLPFDHRLIVISWDVDGCLELLLAHIQLRQRVAVLAELAVPFVKDQFGEVANRLCGINHQLGDSVVETQPCAEFVQLPGGLSPPSANALFSDFGAREWFCPALEVKGCGDETLQHSLLVLPSPLLVVED
jgi:hypothetical protein